MEEQLLKGGNNVKRNIFQINPSDNLQAKLQEQLGEAFLESPEGKALLKQLTPASLRVYRSGGIGTSIGKTDARHRADRPFRETC